MVLQSSLVCKLHCNAATFIKWSLGVDEMKSKNLLFGGGAGVGVVKISKTAHQHQQCGFKHS